MKSFLVKLAIVLTNLNHFVSSEECRCENGEKPILISPTYQRIENTEQSMKSLSNQLNTLKESMEQKGLGKNFTITNCYCENEPFDNCKRTLDQSRDGRLYKIELKTFNRNKFYVSCNNNLQGGGWLVILRRQDGSLKFDKNWKDYKRGFGNIEFEFFLGLDIIHELTWNSPQELLVHIRTNDGRETYAKYDHFAIENEIEKYRISILGEHSGDAIDHLSYHEGCKFSTPDSDNDESSKHCGTIHKAGWWFKDCFAAFLTGTYNDLFSWEKNGETTRKRLSFVEMMIRPKEN